MKALIPLILILFSTAFASPYVTEDFSKGKDLSEGYNLPMALVFTGSDWSESSKKLIREVCEKNLSTQLVIVQVDFPELNRQSEAILSQNHELKEKFQVVNFPTVILLDEKQNEITRMGYPIDEVEDFALHLRDIGRRYFLLQKRFEEAKEKKALGELKVCYHEAKEMGGENLANAILEFGYRDSPDLMLEKYITLIGTKEGEKLRKSLEKVESREIQSRLALLEFQGSNSSEPLERYIAKFGEKSGDHCWKIHMILSEYLIDQEKQEEALEHAQISYRYAPSKERERIQRIIENSFQH